jgi:hypothetical protein
MENSVAELIDELNWVDSLPDEVAWVKVETEGRVIVNCFKGFLRCPEVKCDFGWVNFQSELDAEAVEVVQDWLPSVSEILEALFNPVARCGREVVDEVPDG